MSYSTTIYIGYGINLAKCADERATDENMLSDLIWEKELQHLLEVVSYGDARGSMSNAIIVKRPLSFDANDMDSLAMNDLDQVMGKETANANLQALQTICGELGIPDTEIGLKLYSSTY